MKILSIGNFGTGWDGSICDEEHIAGALEELGHTVTRMQRESVSIATFFDELMVHDKEDKTRYDFILVAQWDKYPDVFRQWKIAMAGVERERIVYWAFDYQADGQEWHERLIKEADLYLSKRTADSKYPNWRWLSQDFAPKFLDRYKEPVSVEKYEQPPLEKDIDVLFTGSYLPWATERNATLKAIDEHFNLVIHSVNAWEGFKDVRPPIMDEGLPELYARAKVILSIDHTLEAGYWSDRVAQALCCRGLVLHRYQPMCEIPFKDKIAYFYGIEDCLERVGGLLEMADEDAELCRQVGYEYADEFLRVMNRVEDLLTIVQEIL